MKKVLTGIVIFLLCLPLFFPLFQIFVIAEETGLVTCWKLDEGSGNVVHDSSGKGNDGTINGAEWVTGVSGSALRFRDSNTYVTGKVPDGVDGNSEFTVSFWVKVNKWPSASAQYAYLVVFGLPGEWNYDEAFHVILGNDGHYSPYGTLRPNFWCRIVPTSHKFTTDVWYNWAFVYDKTKVRMYQNGSFLEDIALGGASPKIDPTGFLMLSSQSRQFFDGILDEVAIYDYARSPADILSDFKAIAGSESPPSPTPTPTPTPMPSQSNRISPEFIELIPQEQQKSCWAASSLMVLKYYGTYETLPSQIELARKVFFGSDYFYYNGLPAFMLPSWDWVLSDVGKMDADPDYGILSEGLTFDKVKADIDLGRPIIALYASDLWAWGWQITAEPVLPYHAVVIVGYEDNLGESNDEVLIYDPWPVNEGTVQNRKWTDVQNDLWLVCNAIRTMSMVREGLIVTLQEPQHKLYLHVYDDQGHHVGFNHNAGQVELGIPGAEYVDYNHTIEVVLPLNLKNFRYTVDATSAEEHVENYTITIKELSQGTVKLKETLSSTISQGETEEQSVEVLSEKINMNEDGEGWWVAPILGMPTYVIIISVVVIVIAGTSFLALRIKKRRSSSESQLSNQK